MISAFATTAAAVTVPEWRIPVEVIDGATRAPLTGAVTMAAETDFWSTPPLYLDQHADCNRAADSVLATGRGALTLPKFEAEPGKFFENARKIDVMAFSKGHCAAHIYTDAKGVALAKWHQMKDVPGLGKLESQKVGEPVTLPLDPSTDDPERRLRYLRSVAWEFGTACPGKSSVSLRTAIFEEAHAIARTPFEKILASQVEVAWSGGHRDVSVPLAFYAETGRMEEFRNEIARSPGDIDARDDAGMTPLMHAAKAMQAPSVKALLAAGARADIVTGTDGYSAIDLVLSRAADEVGEMNSEGRQAHMERMIAMLAAAKPAPTLRAEYRDVLADPGAWKLTPNRRDFWMRVREEVKGLAARPRVEASCESLEAARRTLPLNTGNPR
jgi:hypothetical protein